MLIQTYQDGQTQLEWHHQISAGKGVCQQGLSFSDENTKQYIDLENNWAVSHPSEQLSTESAVVISDIGPRDENGAHSKPCTRVFRAVLFLTAHT